MSLEHLWAGWRGEYVASVPPAHEVGALPGPGEGAGPGEPESAGHPLDAPDRCVFCRIASSGPPSADNGVLWRGRATFAVLNAYPYASGHLMAVPLRHVRTLGDLSEDEAAELWTALRLGVDALERGYGPEGINLGANLGEAAGAGIPRHLHLHAVPRWKGDTNFMTAVADTRVLPETLASSWERLVAVWPESG